GISKPLLAYKACIKPMKILVKNYSFQMPQLQILELWQLHITTWRIAIYNLDFVMTIEILTPNWQVKSMENTISQQSLETIIVSMHLLAIDLIFSRNLLDVLM